MVGEERVAVVMDHDRLEWNKRKEESSKVLMVAQQDVLNKFVVNCCMTSLNANRSNIYFKFKRTKP